MHKNAKEETRDKEGLMAEAVILADGRFPSSRTCLDELDGAETLVCCDGAVDKLLRYGKEPDAIVGDMDSISPESKERFASILQPSDDQESNDLTKAVRYCISQGYGSVLILGATGMREDHSLGNISLLLEYAKGIEVNMRSDHGEFSLLKKSGSYPCHPGQQLSIFSVDNRVRVSSKGLKYPLEELQLSSWYTASLNETTGDEFSLEFESDLPLILFRVH